MRFSARWARQVRAIVFDLGNTLIADPRKPVVRAIAPAAVTALRKHLRGLSKGEFTRVWLDADSRITFPFASHFMQEEAFVTAALSGLGLQREHRALLAPKLLGSYRAQLKKHLHNAGRRSPLRKVLRALRESGRLLVVFSDDRDWATEAMLKWFGIGVFFEGWIFTSEGTGVAKTDPRVFDFLIARIRRRIPDIRPKEALYIGDDWQRDVDSPKRRGWRAVLYGPHRTRDQTTGWRDYARMGKHRPDAVVHSWADVLTLMRR